VNGDNVAKAMKPPKRRKYNTSQKGGSKKVTKRKTIPSLNEAETEKEGEGVRPTSKVDSKKTENYYRKKIYEVERPYSEGVIAIKKKSGQRGGA